MLLLLCSCSNVNVNFLIMLLKSSIILCVGNTVVIDSKYLKESRTGVPLEYAL